MNTRSGELRSTDVQLELDGRVVTDATEDLVVELAKTGRRSLVGLPREARERCIVSGTLDPFGSKRVLAIAVKNNKIEQRHNPARGKASGRRDHPLSVVDRPLALEAQ